MAVNDRMRKRWPYGIVQRARGIETRLHVEALYSRQVAIDSPCKNLHWESGAGDGLTEFGHSSAGTTPGSVQVSHGMYCQVIRCAISVRNHVLNTAVRC